MKTFIYSLKTALKNIWLDKWIDLLTVLSISIGLSIFCTFIIVNMNIESALKQWSKSFGIVAYLEKGISVESEKNIEAEFRRDPEITDVKYISQDLALKEVRQILGPNAIVLDVFEENPLPSSFELKLKTELLDPALVTRKTGRIKQIPGIKDVQYGEKWLSSLNTISRAMRTASMFFGAAIFIAVTFMTYSTIKIFFNRRMEDIETLKLLGAPRGFIRMPFLIEGVLLGTLGGAASSLSLFGIYYFTAVKIVEFIPSISLIFASLPLTVYFLIPLSGAVMSFIGSFIAVGKIRY